MFKDPRMKPVSTDQPGFSALKKTARRKSFKRSQIKRGKKSGKKS
jgi:hypothetical protein